MEERLFGFLIEFIIETLITVGVETDVFHRMVDEELFPWIEPETVMENDGRRRFQNLA